MRDARVGRDLATRVARRWFWLLAAVSMALGNARPVAAQADGTALAVLATIGYGTLSVAAVTRLVHRTPVHAAAGNELRLTVRTPAGDLNLRGQLAALDADSITIRHDGVSERIARGDVRSVRVLVGPERKWAQGWLVGMIGGAALGVGSGFASGDDPPNDWFSFTANQKAAIFGVALGITGSAVGALVGTAIVGDRWANADRLVDRVSVSPILGRRAGLALRVCF